MMNFRHFHFRGSLLLLTAPLLVVAVLIAACGGDDATSADLEFSDMWSRQPVEGQPNAAIYGTVKNTGGSDVRITAVSTEVTTRAELHEVVEVDGLMTMREREDGYVVPAGGTFTFEPGGPHVMVMGIDPTTYPTDEVDVTFSFDAGDDASVTAEVRAVDGTMDMGDGGMDMDHGDDMEHDMEDGMGDMEEGDG